ncbi:MAG: hypothetical protein HUJ90_00605 [Bacteroidales bacterium]|nr:hypothetical protein [Bacteroidales bacterium]
MHTIGNHRYASTKTFVIGKDCKKQSLTSIGTQLKMTIVSILERITSMPLRQTVEFVL